MHLYVLDLSSRTIWCNRHDYVHDHDVLAMTKFFVYSPIGEEQRIARLIDETNKLIQETEAMLHEWETTSLISETNMLIQQAETMLEEWANDASSIAMIDDSTFMKAMDSDGGDAQPPLGSTIEENIATDDPTEGSNNTEDAPRADVSADEEESTTPNTESLDGGDQSTASKSDAASNNVVSLYICVFCRNICADAESAGWT